MTFVNNLIALEGDLNGDLDSLIGDELDHLIDKDLGDLIGDELDSWLASTWMHCGMCTSYDLIKSIIHCYNIGTYWSAFVSVV